MTMYRLYSESASSDGTQYVWELTWRPVRSGESPVVRRISQTERNAYRNGYQYRDGGSGSPLDAR